MSTNHEGAPPPGASAPPRDESGRYTGVPAGAPDAPPPPAPVPPPSQAEAFYAGWQREDTRPQAAERTLRQYGMLPEGMSWDDAQAAIRERHEARENPLARHYAPSAPPPPPPYGSPAAAPYPPGYLQEPPPPPGPAYGPTPPPGYPPAYGAPPAPPAPEFDPYRLQEAWRADQERMAGQMREELMAEQAQMREVEAIQSTLGELASQRQWNEEQRQMIAYAVGSSLDSDIAAGRYVGVADLPAYVRSRVDALAQTFTGTGAPPTPAQQAGAAGAPQTGVLTGAPPGGSPPGRGLSGSAELALAKLRGEA